MRNRALALILFCAQSLTSAFAQDWPSFRGPRASGVADGQNLPERWSGPEQVNIRFQVRLPGLAHSSPIVWGDRLFVTTAVSSAGDDAFKPGLYGEGTASADLWVHRFKVLAFDKKTGGLLWERTAYEGTPKEKRHVKATYANATPATNGEIVVAFFGSHGLYAYDLQGEMLWKRDLGRLDNGAYDALDYEWGTASSPILHDNLVLVQLDTQQEDYLLALDATSGETVWKAERNEMPSWATPNVYQSKGRTEVVTNAPHFIRGNDASTGKELWRLGGSSNITAPTPAFDGDLMIVASGRRPVKPIYVVRAGATGDITLPEGKTASDSIVWSVTGRGSYMPSPLVYRGYLYVLQNEGILDCYELETGREIYRNRIPHHGSGFSGSPIAADGILYLSSEDGDIFAVRAGPEFELLAQNPMGELLMSTPAISDGVMYVRAHRHLFAVSR